MERPDRTGGLPPLQHLARTVRRRMVQEQGLRDMAMLSPWAGGGLLFATLATRALDLNVTVTTLLTVTFSVWMGLVILRVARRWPGEQDALFRWDARIADKEALASAWEFEQRLDRLSPGERLHYERMLRSLHAGMAETAAAFTWPKPCAPWAVLPLACLLLPVGMGWRIAPSSRELDGASSQDRSVDASLPTPGGAVKALEEPARPEPAGLRAAAPLQEAGTLTMPGLEPLSASADSSRSTPFPQNQPVLKTFPAPLRGTHPLSTHTPILPLLPGADATPPGQAALQSLPDPAGPPPPGKATDGQADAGGTGSAAPVPGAPLPMPSEAGMTAPVPGSPAMRAASLARQLGGERSGAGSTPGLEAGAGRKNLRNDPVAALAAHREGRVEIRGQPGGEARVREVMAGEARPGTASPADQLNAAFHRVDEAVRSGQPMPIARREQVVRYFHQLKRMMIDPEAAARE